MEVTMEKGARNYVGLIFGRAHKLAWCISGCGTLDGMVHKLVQAGIHVIKPGFWKPLPSNIRKSYVSHLPLPYGIAIRAFWSIWLLWRSIHNAKIVCIMTSEEL